MDDDRNLEALIRIQSNRTRELRGEGAAFRSQQEGRRRCV